MRRYRIAGAGLAAALLAGCGGSGFAPVAGTVTYNNEPLREGSIEFHPEKGRPAYGKIRDGKIVEVTTDTIGDGARVGPVRVTIQAVTGSGDMYAKHKSLVPDKYGDPAKSGLTADIKSKANDLKFDLK